MLIEQKKTSILLGINLNRAKAFSQFRKIALVALGFCIPCSLLLQPTYPAELLKINTTIDMIRVWIYIH